MERLHHGSMLTAAVMLRIACYADAGSEREAHSGVQGEAAKETRNINLSLLCLVRARM